jgi:hypothetical protein
MKYKKENSTVRRMEQNATAKHPMPKGQNIYIASTDTTLINMFKLI